MMPSVFPDWSPYQDLDSAARAYLRDPDVALEALNQVLSGAQVLGFTLERFVNEHNGVWQEVVVCDGQRLLLWHGEGRPARRRAARIHGLVAARGAVVRGGRGGLPAAPEPAGQRADTR
jgi:hypothetical protein